MNNILQHSLFYGMILSVLGSFVLFGSAYLNPEIMVESYPQDIRKKYGPMSPKAQRFKRLVAIPFGLLLIGILVVSTINLPTVPGPGFYLAVFANTAVILLTFNLVDLLLLDWLIFNTLQPRFIILPGTEGMAGYRDYGFHFASFLKGSAGALLAGLAAAGLVALINSYSLIKLLHVLLSFWFVAGILGRQLLRAAARRTDDIHQFALVTRLAGRFESLMVIPGNLLVILVGVLLAWRGGWPVFGFLQGASANWLLVSNMILLAGILVVPLVYLPRGKLFEQALQEALAAGQRTPALNASMDDPVVRWAHWGEYLGLLLVIGLMVLKPF